MSSTEQEESLRLELVAALAEALAVFKPKKKARIPSRPLQSRGFPKRVEVWQPLSSGDEHD